MMIHERIQNMPEAGGQLDLNSVPRRPKKHINKQNGSRKNKNRTNKDESKKERTIKTKGKKEQKELSIPPRGALPDGSSVNFGHEKLRYPVKLRDDTGKGRKNHDRQYSGEGRKNRAMLQSTALNLKETKNDLKNMLISDSFGEPSLPDGSRPVFGNNKNGSFQMERSESGSRNHSRRPLSGSQSQSRCQSRSRSRSSSRSPPMSASSSYLNLTPPTTSSANHYAELRAPGLQALPDGSRPKFGNATESFPRSKYQNMTSIAPYSTDSLTGSNKIYAGSSFHSSPSAVSLPRPSFTGK